MDREQDAQVFVSYSHTNSRPVSRIAAALQEAGYKVWWDRKLRGGQDFGMEIEAALRGARCAVVAWSADSRNSLWVRAEATQAWETGKLVQVTLDGAKPPLPFTMIQLLNLSSWDGRTAEPTWTDLNNAVQSVMRGEVPSSGIVPDRPPRLGGFESTAVVGAASIALVVLAAGVVVLGVKGAFSSTLFEVITVGMFLAAFLGFAGMVARVIKISMASR
jgi:hypothetical protein